MLTVHIEPLVHHYLRETPKLHLRSKLWSPYSLCSPKKFVSHSRNLFCDFKHPRALVVRANSNAAAIVETFQSTDLFFKETFHLEQKLMVWISFFVWSFKVKQGTVAFGLSFLFGWWRRTARVYIRHTLFFFVCRACFKISKLTFTCPFHFVVY